MLHLILEECQCKAVLNWSFKEDQGKEVLPWFFKQHQGKEGHHLDFKENQGKLFHLGFTEDQGKVMLHLAIKEDQGEVVYLPLTPGINKSKNADLYAEVQEHTQRHNANLPRRTCVLILRLSPAAHHPQMLTKWPQCRPLDPILSRTPTIPILYVLPANGN